MKIAKKYLAQAKGNQKIITRLVMETGKSYHTILRWLNTNSEMLTKVQCLTILSEELAISQDQLLEKAKA